MRLIKAVAGDIYACEEEETLEALGIPYARAERFAYPLPVKLADFGSPYRADSPAPAAPQHLRGENKDIRQSVLISEDCQNLSVITPLDAQPEEKLPVMVFLHGGSYLVGSGDGARYNPQRLVADERVVVVRVTFRLGLLGFLGGSTSRPANLGLLDVIQALRWVKENIAAFGGNPGNITVFGQSAGADLATQLMISEGVVQEGLLHKVIAQSGPLDLVNNKSKLNSAMLEATANIPDHAPVEVFAERGWKMVLQSPLPSGLYRAMMPFGTQYGHYPLPPQDQVEKAWKEAAPRVAVLAGANLRESAYFIPQLDKKLGRLGKKIGDYLIKKGSREMYLQPAQALVDRHRAAGGVGASYALAVGSPLHHLYSCHSSELALLFDNPAWEGAKLLAGSHADERAVQGQALRAIWAEFARSASLRQDLAQQARISFS